MCIPKVPSSIRSPLTWLAGGRLSYAIDPDPFQDVGEAVPVVLLENAAAPLFGLSLEHGRGSQGIDYRRREVVDRFDDREVFPLFQTQPLGTDAGRNDRRATSEGLEDLQARAAADPKWHDHQGTA